VQTCRSHPWAPADRRRCVGATCVRLDEQVHFRRTCESERCFHSLMRATADSGITCGALKRSWRRRDLHTIADGGNGLKPSTARTAFKWWLKDDGRRTKQVTAQTWATRWIQRLIPRGLGCRLHHRAPVKCHDENFRLRRIHRRLCHDKPRMSGNRGR
jgi:hypothetical protein